MLTKVWTMVRWSLARRGFAGTVRTLSDRVLGMFQRTPAQRTHPFDVRYGTETSGLIGGGRLAAGSASDRHITAYAGIAPSRLSGALERWTEELQGRPLAGFTFVDLGCGKGRAVLLASQYGFRRVVGIEINPGLASIARENVGKWSAAGLAVSPVEVLTGDATAFALPTGDCLLYLYNPFSEVVTRAVLDGVERQKQDGDALYVIYQNEGESTPLRGDARLERVWTGSLAQTEEDQRADPVSAPEDVTSIYRWRGQAG